MKITIIYHSADYDGILCREIAHKFLPNAELIGWNFGDAKVVAQPDIQYYVLDLSPECLNWELMGHNERKQVIWIDHHKTSIEKWPADIPGYRIDGVAACRLAWQYFSLIQTGMPTPTKKAFIDRNVVEPYAVRLAGEYDIWDKRDTNADTFQYALRAEPLTPAGWAALLDDDRAFVNDLLVKGRTCQRYAQSVDGGICQAKTWLMEWENLKFLCVNHARFNSQFFAARDVPETGHDALLGFCYNGKVWTVSLYHARHRTELDLSEIAKRHGGGGHRGACGFTCSKLPWPMP